MPAKIITPTTEQIRNISTNTNLLKTLTNKEIQNAEGVLVNAKNEKMIICKEISRNQASKIRKTFKPIRARKMGIAQALCLHRVWKGEIVIK